MLSLENICYHVLLSHDAFPSCCKRHNFVTVKLKSEGEFCFYALHIYCHFTTPPHTHLTLTLVNDFIGNATQCDKKTSPNVYKTCLKIISQEK